MHSSESTNSSLDDIFLEKALFAGCCKNFVGTGSRKISKAEIKRLNIPRLTEIVSDLVVHSSFPLLSTYCLGICRIYEKAVDFLLEDLQKFNDELNSALIGVHKRPSKSKKNKTETEEEELLENPNLSMELCEESVFIRLFQRDLETDRNLLHEIDIAKDPGTLGDFGDEIHLNQQDHRGGPWLSPSDEVAQLAQSIISNHQITGGGEIHASTPAVDDRPVGSTPKRKPRQSHDETPKKRQKKSQTLANGSEGRSSAARKLFVQGGQSSSMPDNSEERSSEAGRLIEQDGQSSSMPDYEMILNGADGNGMESFHEHMPVEGFSEEGQRSSSQQFHTVQDLEPDRQSMPIAPDVSGGAQIHPDQLLEDNEDLELEELNDESIAELPPKRRRRLKKWRDEEIKIPKPLDINQMERFTRVHTREVGPTLFFNRLQKQPVANLFSLPATRLKVQTKRGPKNICFFGMTLLNLYSEMVRQIIPANDETPARTSQPSLPRDANVNKRPRFSTFRGDSRQRPSVPSTSEDQNITFGGGNGYNEDRDRELMPPPSPRVPGGVPEIHIEPPSLPSLDQQQSPQRQLPGTPHRRQIRPDTPGVSPIQSRPVPNNLDPILADVPNDDSVNPPGLPFDDDSGPRSHHMIESSPSSVSMTSEMERTSLMEVDAFYQFLKDRWVAMSDKVDLNDIIPRRSTLVAFFRYFVFLQRLQKKGKLTMLQEIIYGPVHIVKEREE